MPPTIHRPMCLPNKVIHGNLGQRVSSRVVLCESAVLIRVDPSKPMGGADFDVGGLSICYAAEARYVGVSIEGEKLAS